VNLIDKSKVVIGGDCDPQDKYISPTIMFNVTKEDKVMHEEIFGPILPFVTVSNHEEAIDFINDG
jgi:acyl-CoA reductase-like NAD-dependent aldehyde dehydrogenase